ncbi:MAG TPA: Gfo/Idh/MocA family oxidoreductase [Spirochaetota bacterium]|nr:Gfo/Idh/MocA family oxidoreductase [Spirochaetota bacterium]HPI88791.1 Gfo/Idh/MocA family oxidoreductase [Spirochaetota bacterium]HPR47135.1 Gfo/Idh/MocA family oxidoreductase [Spirochaetota bacterium]
MSENLRIGFVGCGRISKRHFEAIEATKGIEIGMICDIDEEKAHNIASRYNVPYVTDIREIKNVDIITIATPSGHHPRHVMKAAENLDAKFIVCEKPVSLTVREAVEMFNLIRKYDKILLPIYQNRYNPLIHFIRDLILSGKIGIIYQINVNVYWNRNDDYYRDSWHGSIDVDGGVLYTQASHYIDMLLFLFGPITEAKGFGGKLRGFPTQDSVSASIIFKNGTVGSLNATVCSYRKNYCTEATIIAEKGTIRLSGTNLNTIEYWDVENMEKPDMDFTIDHIYGKGHDTMYQYIVENKLEMFPRYEEVIAGISLMEKLSF